MKNSRTIVNKPETAGGWGAEALHHVAEIPDRLPGDQSTDDRDQGEMLALLHRALELVRADRTWQAFWQATVDGHSPNYAKRRWFRGSRTRQRLANSRSAANVGRPGRMWNC